MITALSSVNPVNTAIARAKRGHSAIAILRYTDVSLPLLTTWVVLITIIALVLCSINLSKDYPYHWYSQSSSIYNFKILLLTLLTFSFLQVCFTLTGIKANNSRSSFQINFGRWTRFYKYNAFDKFNGKKDRRQKFRCILTVNNIHNLRFYGFPNPKNLKNPIIIFRIHAIHKTMSPPVPFAHSTPPTLLNPPTFTDRRHIEKMNCSLRHPLRTVNLSFFIIIVGQYPDLID